MKLRYVGVIPVMFTQSSAGEVFPGDEFEVPEVEAEALLARADIEQAPVRAVKARKTQPVAEPAPEPEPAAEPAAKTA